MGAEVLADQAVGELLKLEELTGRATPKLAIMGFSVGPTLGHGLARRLTTRGHPPLCLYACGRAGPTVKYHHKNEQQALKAGDAEYLRWFMNAFTPPEAVATMERILSST